MLCGRRRSEVDIVEAILWVVGLFIPEKDSRFRRIRRLGCFLFGGLGIVVVIAVLLDLYVFRSQ